MNPILYNIKQLLTPYSDSSKNFVTFTRSSMVGIKIGIPNPSKEHYSFRYPSGVYSFQIKDFVNNDIDFNPKLFKRPYIQILEKVSKRVFGARPINDDQYDAILEVYIQYVNNNIETNSNKETIIARINKYKEIYSRKEKNNKNLYNLIMRCSQFITPKFSFFVSDFFKEIGFDIIVSPRGENNIFPSYINSVVGVFLTPTSYKVIDRLTNTFSEIQSV